jgi:hypothetical protein
MIPRGGAGEARSRFANNDAGGPGGQAQQADEETQ